MKPIRIGINGFGRIGRIAARIILNRQQLVFAAVNSRTDAKSHAYLLKYDSTYKSLDNNLKEENGTLVVDEKRIAVFQSENIADIPWEKANIDIVIDSTGKFRTIKDLKKHLSGGAKYVILSAPAKDNMKTLVMGVNHHLFDPDKDRMVSNSSCTTNCLAVLLKVLNDSLGVQKGFMTTTHAVTDSQNLLDNSHKKEVRLRRASFQSLIPATTGSAHDIGKLFPRLKGRIICQSVRAPVPTVSLLNLTVLVSRKVSKDDVNSLFVQASHSSMKGILEIAHDELVSSDYVGCNASAVIDPFLTRVLDENFINIYAWYDNEWGYASRLVDLVEHIGQMAKLL